MPVVEDAVAVRAVPEPDRLPTLTEVVQLASDPWAAAALAAATARADVGPVAAPEPDAGTPASSMPTVQWLVEAIEPPLPGAATTEPMASHVLPPLAVPALESPAPPELAASPAPPAPDEDQITRQVLAALEQRLDGLFEARLREALAPALARVADGLIRDLRPELTQALHDMVHDAVLRALQDTPPR